MRTLILIILSLLLLSCASLKSVRHSERHQQVVVDNSLTEVVRTEIERQIGSLNQTVVEFYPPHTRCRVTPTPRERPDKEQEEQDEEETEDDEPQPRQERPPIKSITTTQITTHADRATQSDSTKLSDIVEHIDTNTKEQTEEQPSNFVLSIKWLAIIMGVILIIILILKLR